MAHIASKLFPHCNKPRSSWNPWKQVHLKINCIKETTFFDTWHIKLKVANHRKKNYLITQVHCCSSASCLFVQGCIRPDEVAYVCYVHTYLIKTILLLEWNALLSYSTQRQIKLRWVFLLLFVCFNIFCSKVLRTIHYLFICLLWIKKIIALLCKKWSGLKHSLEKFIQWTIIHILMLWSEKYYKNCENRIKRQPDCVKSNSLSTITAFDSMATAVCQFLTKWLSADIQTIVEVV